MTHKVSDAIANAAVCEISVFDREQTAAVTLVPYSQPSLELAELTSTAESVFIDTESDSVRPREKICKASHFRTDLKVSRTMMMFTARTHVARTVRICA